MRKATSETVTQAEPKKAAAKGTEVNVTLGREIRQLRKAKGISLTEFAKLTDRSIGFLSSIERGLVRPSVSTLQVISEVLDMQVGWFFPEQNDALGRESRIVVRRDRGRRLAYANVGRGGQLGSTDYLGTEDYLLSPDLEGDMICGLTRMAAGSSQGDEPLAYEGETVLHVLEGRIELELSGELFVLEKGDTAQFRTSEPHRWRNVSDAQAVLFWTLTPVILHL